MKVLKFLAITGLAIVLSACKHELPSIGGYKMFYLPSGNYKSGQVFAIYTKPKKIDIIHNTQLQDGDYLASKSADFTAEETKKLDLYIKGVIQNELDAKLGVKASNYINVKYTNTKVVDAVHTKVFSRIKADMDSDPGAKAFIKSLVTKKEVKLDVATSILTADIELTIKDDIEAGLDLSVPKLLDTLEVGFGPSLDSDRSVVGKQLAIGFHADPHIISLLVEEFK
jgi:hypothetical protein